MAGFNAIRNHYYLWTNIIRSDQPIISKKKNDLCCLWVCAFLPSFTLSSAQTKTIIIEERCRKLWNCYENILLALFFTTQNAKAFYFSFDLITETRQAKSAYEDEEKWAISSNNNGIQWIRKWQRALERWWGAAWAEGSAFDDDDRPHFHLQHFGFLPIGWRRPKFTASWMEVIRASFSTYSSSIVWYPFLIHIIWQGTKYIRFKLFLVTIRHQKKQKKKTNNNNSYRANINVLLAKNSM